MSAQKELRELERFVDELYAHVGQKYRDEFQYIVGGCHCAPATEWLGGIKLAFSKVLKENAITDSALRSGTERYLHEIRL